MLKIVQFGWEIFTLILWHTEQLILRSWQVTYFALVPMLYKPMCQEKNDAVRIAPKLKNNLETSPYAVKRHNAIRPSDYTLQVHS